MLINYGLWWGDGRRNIGLVFWTFNRVFFFRKMKNYFRLNDVEIKFRGNSLHAIETEA